MTRENGVQLECTPCQLRNGMLVLSGSAYLFPKRDSICSADSVPTSCKWLTSKVTRFSRTTVMSVDADRRGVSGVVLDRPTQCAVRITKGGYSFFLSQSSLVRALPGSKIRKASTYSCRLAVRRLHVARWQLPTKQIDRRFLSNGPTKNTSNMS
jgi:hypothetical protein